MQTHSHKLMVMAAATYVAVLYGSETGMAVLVPGGPWRSAEMSSLTPVFAAFTGGSRSPEQKGPATKPGASVLPNSASCPAAGALAAPPSVDTVIGKNEPALTQGASAHPQGSTELGTGGGCAQLPADAARAGAALPGTAPTLESRASAKPRA